MCEFAEILAILSQNGNGDIIAWDWYAGYLSHILANFAKALCKCCRVDCKFWQICTNCSFERSKRYCPSQLVPYLGQNSTVFTLNYNNFWQTGCGEKVRHFSANKLRLALNSVREQSNLIFFLSLRGYSSLCSGNQFLFALKVPRAISPHFVMCLLYIQYYIILWVGFTNFSAVPFYSVLVSFHWENSPLCSSSFSGRKR